MDTQISKTNAEISDSHDRIGTAKDDKTNAEVQLAQLTE
jgi:hypothetical protein